jgi:protein SCO1/2
MRRELAGLLVFVAGVGIGCSNNTARQPGEGLPFYESAEFTPRWSETVAHTIGDFSLTTQTGETITRDDLRGRLHVASFIYTRCNVICPTLVKELSKVQAAIAARDDVLLVSYSVAPRYDSVAVLNAFGAEYSINPVRWKLLTGDEETIYRLARDSYFADDGRLENNETSAGLLHTEKVLLVDEDGHLRGVYNGSLSFEIKKLIADIELLRLPDKNLS